MKVRDDLRGRLVGSRRHCARIFCIALLMIPLAACTDGNDESSSDVDFSGPNAQGAGGESATGSDSADGASDRSVNGPLTGRLLSIQNVPTQYALQTLDLSSGQWTPLESDVAPAIFRNFPGSTIALERDFSGQGGIVATVFNCGELTICVTFFDDEGRANTFFSFDETVDPIRGRANLVYGSGIVRRSRDGTLIAYTEAEEHLVISDLEGRIVSRTYVGIKRGSPYDWLPNGGLLYSMETELLSGRIKLGFSFPGSTDVEHAVDLNGYNGELRKIRVSPDGNLAFLTFNAGLSLVPIVLDLRTLQTYEPVSSQRSSFVDVRSVSWSPDSQWLIFRENNFIPQDVPVPNAAIVPQVRPVGTVFAVRANGQTHPLPLSVEESNENVRIVVARPINDPDGALSPEYATQGRVWID